MIIMTVFYFASSNSCLQAHIGPKHRKQSSLSVWGQQQGDDIIWEAALPWPSRAIQPLEAGAV